MTAQMQNPGLAPRASRDCFGGPSQSFLTASEAREQMLAFRFCLSPSMARDIARLCFGEAQND
ncbi:hypothetical protein [Sneathiella sp.]|uniref:hypothetical protein n=1 Tax=Sneathiella sp. TaxID=1964365 RepID=UPI00356A62E7